MVPSLTGDQANANDVDRLTNRGGRLLREEKFRKAVAKEMPKVRTTCWISVDLSHSWKETSRLQRRSGRHRKGKHSVWMESRMFLVCCTFQASSLPNLAMKEQKQRKKEDKERAMAEKVARLVHV